MKQELLENLIRLCVRQVLENINEIGDETRGASAPPADDQGTADQPSIPTDRGEKKPGEDSGKDSGVPTSADLKGIILVNHRDKSKLMRVSLSSTGNDSVLERELYRQAATIAGSKVIVALATIRLVRDAVRNPNATTFLYFGKYDPNSDEVFLMADKSLQVAKDSSITPADLTGTAVSQTAPRSFQDLTATPSDLAYHISQKGQTPVHGVRDIDERLGKVIKKMVNEVITGKR